MAGVFIHTKLPMSEAAATGNTDCTAAISMGINMPKYATVLGKGPLKVSVILAAPGGMAKVLTLNKGKLYNVSTVGFSATADVLEKTAALLGDANEYPSTGVFQATEISVMEQNDGCMAEHTDPMGSVNV